MALDFGAWRTYYYLRSPRMGDLNSATTTAETMVCWAILSLKNELAYQGLGKSLTLNTVFGKNLQLAVKAFQSLSNLEIDGVVGPVTAKALYQARITVLQESLNIPDQYICRITGAESSYDPGAIGVVDHGDLGLVQEHSEFNPDVTEEQAASGSWALQYVAERLTSAFHTLNDWPAAAVSYNVGVGGAQEWLAAGKPSTGGPANDPELYERATAYLTILHAQNCG